MIPVVWLNFNKDAPNRGYWDQGLLEQLVAGKLWDTGQYQYESFDSLPSGLKGAVLIVPGRQNAEYFSDVQDTLNLLEWAVVVVTGDEENEFPGEQLQHPNMRLWAMTPNPGRYESASVLLGSGMPPGMTEELEASRASREERPLDWFFAGQVTHPRREDCATVLRGRERGELIETPGFTQGVPQAEYWHALSDAKVAPCPGGPVSPDSFRLFEALEAGCVPVADKYSGKKSEGDVYYWWRVFPEDPPFPIVDEWTEFPSLLSDIMAGWPQNANLTFAGWQRYKRELAYKLDEDVCFVSGIPFALASGGRITALVPTSPIPSNPSTEIIDETIRSIRDRLPSAEILIMCDGVREEQSSSRASYDEYVRRLTWKCNYEWTNVLPVVYGEHLHQGAMTRRTLDLVRTPLMMFVEHDTPIIGEVPWGNLSDAILTGEAHVIRLHHEAQILKPHAHLMLSTHARRVCGVPLLPTVQWSQRPHLASTDWYRWMINTYFADSSRTMIEDLIYGVLETHYREDDLSGWNRFKLFIYAPEGDMKRSTHTDGRDGEPKYSMVFEYDGDIPQWAPHEGRRD